MMNKIAVIYFSGTGNTKFIAKNIKNKLQEYGYESDLINIEKDKIISQSIEVDSNINKNDNLNINL